MNELSQKHGKKTTCGVSTAWGFPIPSPSSFSFPSHPQPHSYHITILIPTPIPSSFPPQSHLHPDRACSSPSHLRCCPVQDVVPGPPVARPPVAVSAVLPTGRPPGTHRRPRGDSPAGIGRWKDAGAQNYGRSSRTPSPSPSRGVPAPPPAAVWRPWPVTGARLGSPARQTAPV